MEGGAPLAAVISERIGREGPLTVADYMEMCLTHPAYGYYRTRDVIGAQGDFITAPEISQIFGELLGVWMAACWGMMGQPKPFNLIEFGPGRGTLMADALRAGDKAAGFTGAARLYLIEVSGHLRELQAARLSAYRPEWRESLAGIAPGPSVIIANEFFDALPVRQLIFSGGVWRERRIASAGPGLHFIEGEAVDDEELLQLSVPPGAAEGDCFEFSPHALALMDGVARLHLGGPLAGLIIDYGHHGEGYGETLQAVSGHAFADPLRQPGRHDLSAHVNFAALGQRAESAGLIPHGPMPMGAFLLKLGAGKRLDALCARASVAQSQRLIDGLRRLTSPMEMGELFKVMAVTGGLPPPPPF